MAKQLLPVYGKQIIYYQLSRECRLEQAVSLLSRLDRTCRISRNCRAMAGWERGAGAAVFACHVNDPQRYRVIQFGPAGQALPVGEKPLVPKSDYAATGLYFHDGGPAISRPACVPGARRTRNQRY